MADRHGQRSAARARTRWAIFAQSVISPIGNADAYLLRALGRALLQQGHEATFYEERGNPALQRLLRRDGARGLDAFRTKHPEITYRTIERRVGADLVEWLTRTLATADVALVQASAPAPLAAWVGRLTRPHLRTYLLDTGWAEPLAPAGIAERDPGHFSAVFVGSGAATGAYEACVSPARLRPLAALPDPADVRDGDALAVLRPIASDLLAAILADCSNDEQADRSAETTQSRPRGSAVGMEPPVTR